MLDDVDEITESHLPHQISDLNALVEAVKRTLPDYPGVAAFIEALAKYQSFADVKNVGAAVHAMTKAALHGNSGRYFCGSQKI